MSPILVPTLTELRIELDRLQSASVRAWNSIVGELGDPSHEALCDIAVAASAAVDNTIAAIADLPAASLADLRVKAHTLHLLDQTIGAIDNPDTTDTKLIRQLIAGLLDERIA